jgi:hypothetical protein
MIPMNYAFFLALVPVFTGLIIARTLQEPLFVNPLFAPVHLSN